MLNQCYYSCILSPAGEGLELGDYEMPSMHVCVPAGQSMGEGDSECVDFTIF